MPSDIQGPKGRSLKVPGKHRNPEKAFLNPNLKIRAPCQTALKRLIAVVAVHGGRCGLALIQLQHGSCIKMLRGSPFLVL